MEKNSCKMSVVPFLWLYDQLIDPYGDKEGNTGLKMVRD